LGESGTAVTLSIGEVTGLLSALVWAINGLVIRTQSAKMPPALMNSVRCAVGMAFFWTLLPFDSGGFDYGEVTDLEWVLLMAALVVGVGFGDMVYLIAIRDIGVSRTLALTGIYPLTTLLFEQLLLDLPLRPAFAAGSFLVTAGVLSLASGRVTDSIDDPTKFRRGVIVALSAAFMWGFGTVLLRPAIAHMTPVQANSIRMPLVALLFFVLWWVTRGTGKLREMERKAFMWVGVTGLLGMGIGSYLFLFTLQHIGPAKTATLTAATPVFGLLMSMAFLKEKLTVKLAVGVGLCVGGVLLVL